MSYHWRFDEASQILHSPGGYSISVHEIAVALQDKVRHRFDLTGPWLGWKVRGSTITGPRGQRLFAQIENRDSGQTK